MTDEELKAWQLRFEKLLAFAKTLAAGEDRDRVSFVAGGALGLAMRVRALERERLTMANLVAHYEKLRARAGEIRELVDADNTHIGPEFCNLLDELLKLIEIP